jgi:eukaryotic-like serine/threonine-protein kinase
MNHQGTDRGNSQGGARETIDPRDSGSVDGVSSPEEIILDLMASWEDQYRRGLDPTPESVCARHPELTAEFRAKMCRQKAFLDFLQIRSPERNPDSRDESALPAFPDHETLALIDTGGMGVVYKARDLGLGRIVAIKTIAAGQYASSDQLARFHAEAHAVARLHHPNIIAIHAIGDHGNRPYLSLEFAEGGSLSRHLAGKPMAPREVAALVETLARAVHVAHEAGIVHRDLKPSNVLLTAEGVPKISDFGLAKLLDADAGRTITGQPLGTPSYMAPEQTDERAKRVGRGTDVYGLGSILYEALTGRPPFLGASPLETIRLVNSTEPIPPRQARPEVPRDLETICLKCLQKEPIKRYASAAALAEDLRRFLEARPILARRATLPEQLMRWCRRNPWAAAFLVALAAGVIGLGTMTRLQARANQKLMQANRKTELALAETKEAKKETELALEQSEESRKQTDAVVTFLVDVFSSPDPEQDGREVKVVDVLDRARAKLDQGFTGSQATKGALLNVLGLTYVGLGLGDQAVTIQRKALEVREAALGRDDPVTLGSRGNLAVAYGAAGRLSEAIALDEETLTLMQEKLGLNHADTLVIRNNLADRYRNAGRPSEAIAMDESTLNLREANLGSDHPDTLQTRNNLALDYWAVGRFDKAITLQEQTFRIHEAELGPDHPITLMSRANLAALYEAAGRLREAIALYDVSLNLMLSKLGPDHPVTLASRHNLANAYRIAGRVSEAIAQMEPTIKLLEASPGADHPYTLESRANLAEAYESLRRWSDAERLLRDVLARRRKTVKSESPLVAGDLAQLAENLLNQGRWSEAEPLLREALGIRKKATLDAWERSEVMSLLGGSLLGQGRYADAERLIVEGYEGMKAGEARIPVPMRSRLLEAAMRVVKLYEAWNKPKHATDWKGKLGLSDLPACVFDR